MKEIEKGVEQISQVVESNSAAAEETSATTANPLPASPALAASIAAFKESKFVCDAISSIFSIILLISLEVSSIFPIAPVNLSATLKEIHEASAQVEAGASQMAESAQSLAEGATEQAGAVEELLATVSEVTVHVEENAKATDQAHDRANVVAKVAKTSQDKMKDLTGAMGKIEETSKEISNIIAIWDAPASTCAEAS